MQMLFLPLPLPFILTLITLITLPPLLISLLLQQDGEHLFHGPGHGLQLIELGGQLGGMKTHVLNKLQFRLQ